MYEYRLNNGLCTRCGKPLDRDGSYCEKCKNIRNEYQRKNREFYKRNKICPICKKERLLGDEKTCPECRAKNSRDKARQYERNAEKIKKQQIVYYKKRYKERVENGLCTKCGKRKPTEGYKMCNICRAKSRESKRINYKPKIQDRWNGDVCYRCGNPIEDKRYKLCNKCVEQNRNATLNVDRTNHIWKQYDKSLYAKRKETI